MKRTSVGIEFGFKVAEAMDKPAHDILSAEERRRAVEALKGIEAAEAKKRKAAPASQSAGRSNTWHHHNAVVGPSNPAAAAGPANDMAMALTMLAQAQAQAQAQNSSGQAGQAGKAAAHKSTGPAVPPGNKQGACFHCQSPFHWSKECPQKHGNGRF